MYQTDVIANGLTSFRESEMKGSNIEEIFEKDDGFIRDYVTARIHPTPSGVPNPYPMHRLTSIDEEISAINRIKANSTFKELAIKHFQSSSFKYVGTFIDLYKIVYSEYARTFPIEDIFEKKEGAFVKDDAFIKEYLTWRVSNSKLRPVDTVVDDEIEAINKIKSGEDLIKIARGVIQKSPDKSIIIFQYLYQQVLKELTKKYQMS